MAHSVRYTKSNNPDEAFEAAKGQITADYLQKWNVNADISYDKPAHKISAKGKGFDLSLTFKESETLLDVNLSLMLKPFKGKIVSTIEEKLKRHV